MIKYDLAKYASKFLIGTGVLELYNIFVDGKKFDNLTSWYDAMSFGASNVIASVGNDLIFEFLNLSNQGLIPMLTEPLFNMFVYQYMYDNISRPNYRGLSGERSRTQTMVVGFGGNILLKFVENPILGLWGMKSY